jgi:hypothetical protein
MECERCLDGSLGIARGLKQIAGHTPTVRAAFDQRHRPTWESQILLS